MSEKSVPRLKDGYYVAGYLTHPGVPWLLDVITRHDNAVALLKAEAGVVSLVRYWELERLSGIKHHGVGLPNTAALRRFLDDLLKSEGTRLDEVEEIWGIPELAPWRSPFAGEGLPIHSIHHLMTAIYRDSPIFETSKILGLALDAGPDVVHETADSGYWYAGCFVDNGTLSLFPVQSPAPLYETASKAFDMQEGTLMALAEATSASVAISAEATLDDIEFWGGQGVWTDAAEILRRITDYVDSAVGVAQLAATSDPRFSSSENRISAVMKAVDAVCTQVVDPQISGLIERFQVEPAETYLALAGGFALNCPTNTRLLDSFRFRGLLAPPCVDDSGQALGLALAQLYRSEPHARSVVCIKGAAFGIPNGGLTAATDEHADYVRATSPFCAEQFYSDITSGPVVWVSGDSEIGPRALGQRSILGDPRSQATKAELNRIKGRQWWRPVAPIVLSEQSAEWFESQRASPFMLEAVAIRRDKLGLIPAVAHLNGTARLQTLDRVHNASLYDAIQAFRDMSGVPMLCNTSLNDKGEPIIATYHEALNFALRKGISVVYADTTRVELENHSAYPLCSPLPREYARIFEAGDSPTVNPWDLSDLELFMWLEFAELRKLDIASEREASRVRETFTRAARLDPNFAPSLARVLDQRRSNWKGKAGAAAPAASSATP